jgi:hypothetical protein
MEITVKKTGTPVIVTIKTSITPAQLRLCPAAATLYDKDGNALFKVSESKTASVSEFGVVFARGEKAADGDGYVINLTETGTLTHVKEKYAGLIDPLTKVEDQLAKAYKVVGENMDHIKEVD